MCRQSACLDIDFWLGSMANIELKFVELIIHGYDNDLSYQTKV